MSQKEASELLNQVQSEINDLLKKLEESGSITQASIIKNQGLDIFNKYFSYIKDIPAQDKRQYGQRLNELKVKYLQDVQNHLEKLKNAEYDLLDRKNQLDVSEVPYTHFQTFTFSNLAGTAHPLMMEIKYMNEIWQNLGFKVFEGRELDTDDYVFEKLNIPKGHPAREMWDTFYTQEGFVPTTQTSNMQVRMMHYYKKPPIRAAVYGKVFRNEELDAVHSHTFFQYEIVYIDKGVNLTNLIAILVEFLKMYYNKQTIEYRIMPAHFPFVEPGLEMHLRYNNSWLEVLGAGMIHPTVLEAGGINPDEYSGFAAGFGIDRMVMLKHNISDLRDLYQGNITMYLE